MCKGFGKSWRDQWPVDAWPLRLLLGRGWKTPGEFQFNVVVPTGLANGDQLIVATDSGVTTQAGARLTVQN